jgi:hypothetical protein
VRAVAAMVAGRARWVARMQRAKAAGIITRLPGGRRPRGEGAAPKVEGRLIGTAQRMVAMAKSELLVADDGQGSAERLTVLTAKSFDVADAILSAPIDLEDKKLLSIQKDTALSIIATQVRVDESVMRERHIDRLPEMLARIEAIKADAAAMGRVPKIIDATATSEEKPAP